jgi:uncharacterized protein (DUF433 family)
MTLAIALEPTPIETDPHGVVRVAKTRVTLDTIVTAFLEGCTPEEIGEQYPSLQLSSIYLVIGYYLRHQDEVHAYLAERQHQANVIQQEAEQRFNPIGIRIAYLLGGINPGNPKWPDSWLMKILTTRLCEVFSVKIQTLILCVFKMSICQEQTI